MTKENYKKELEKKIYKMSITQLENFIDKLLATQRKEIIKMIEKLPTGMFDSTPYKKIIIAKLNND